MDVANSGGLCLGAVAEGDGEVVRWGPQVGEGALEWGHVPGRAGVEHKAAGVARGWRRLGGEGSRLGWCRERKGDGGGEGGDELWWRRLGGDVDGAAVGAKGQLRLGGGLRHGGEGDGAVLLVPRGWRCAARPAPRCRRLHVCLLLAALASPVAWLVAVEAGAVAKVALLVGVAGAVLALVGAGVA